METTSKAREFIIPYLIMMLVQLPIWLGAGLFWGFWMMVLAGWELRHALAIGVFGWGVSMYVIAGNVFAVMFAWRRSATIKVVDLASFRSALDRVCRKQRYRVRAETPNDIVLMPKWALIRFRLQEIVVKFVGDSVTVTGPALTISPFVKQLKKLST